MLEESRAAAAGSCEGVLANVNISCEDFSVSVSAAQRESRRSRLCSSWSEDGRLNLQTGAKCLFTAALKHNTSGDVWCVRSVPVPLQPVSKICQKLFFVFVLGSSLNNVYSALFFFLPAYFIFSLLELFLLSCFMNVLTVTSLLVWQMNTASSTNPFKSRVFVFVASFYRHQSIRNGTAVKLQRHSLTVGGPAGPDAVLPVYSQESKTRREKPRRAPSGPARALSSH